MTAPLPGAPAVRTRDDGERAALRKRSMTIAGHRTSLSLEQAFWDALQAQAAAEGLSLAALVARIDRERSGNLSSAVRVYLLEQARRAVNSTDP